MFRAGNPEFIHYGLNDLYNVTGGRPRKRLLTVIHYNTATVDYDWEQTYRLRKRIW